MSSQFRVLENLKKDFMPFCLPGRKGRGILLLFFFLACFSAFAQTPTREKLEQRRLELQQEIKKINDLLIGTRKQEKSILAQVTDLNQRIKATENLIAVINREANLLTDEIASNQEKIERLEKELEELKADYSEMIKRSHRSSSKQNRLMFLFSSENFLQAYKRLQYMKQYADYRRSQGLEIKRKADELVVLNEDLIKQRKAKEKLLAEKKTVRENLQKDKKEQQALVAEVMKKEDAFANQIYQKQQEVDKIDRQIKEFVSATIAAENAKKGSANREVFEMTPRAAALAADFESNKGKLPWPVESGVVTTRYGTRPHPIFKHLSIKSNGVRIRTAENTKVQAVFGGAVSDIIAVRGGHMIVIVRHGNYLTVYHNLSNVSVRKGQEVSIGQTLGEVSKSNASQKPSVYFSIFKNNQVLDPADWIYKM